MTLRKKALLIIGVVLICLVGFIYVASRFILLEGLAEIEENQTHRNVERVLGALYSGISDVETQTMDWAAWDDTYAFIEDGNSEYIESNLVDGAFINMRLNLMLFIYSSGELVFGKAFNLQNEEEIPISPGLQRYLSDNRPLLEQPGVESSRSGILLLTEAPMLIVSRPILTSDDEGPARGTLIFGRYLDSVELSRLSRLVILPLSIYPINDSQKYSDFRQALVSLLAGNSVFVQPLNEDYVGGYALLRDIYGNPALILRVDTPRDVYQQGQASVAYFIVVLLGIGLLAGGIVMLVLEKQVMSRFVRLTNSIEGIAASGNVSTRVSMTGTDELKMVADTINGMLGALQQSQAELKGLYENEKKLRREVEAEMNRRIEFTRALVHELKTPITPVLAASELLLEEVKEEPVASLSRSIHRGASNLNKRIDELLDLARSEIGTLQLNPRPVDLIELIEEIATGATPQATENKQHLSLELPSSLSAVWADRDRLTQVMQNILNNAFKFTPEGGKITIRAREEDANLIVEVEDTGRGMSKDEQERLFDPYHRLPGDRERFSGLGLGLALSKKFVELHGGQIWVKSKRGAGSTFGFSIPINPPPEVEESKPGRKR